MSQTKVPNCYGRNRRGSIHRSNGRAAFPALVALLGAAIVLLSVSARAQDKPTFVIQEDCQAFAISQDNRIVYAVPKIKRVKKVVIERDEIWTSALNGKQKQIVEVDKFMPVPPPSTYVVNSLAWSPDGRRIVANMTVIKAPPAFSEDDSAPPPSPEGTKSIALLDDDGHEVKVEGSKTRFIENATHGTWLADGVSLVYLTGAGPYNIVRVNPASGNQSTLFEGHLFDDVLWDAKNNRAFAVGKNLSLSSRLALVELDLLHESVREIARLDAYQGKMSLSPSGKWIGYFMDGDTIEVRSLDNPLKPLQASAGFGRFQWSRDEKRVLLKRGSDDRSNDLVWVGLTDETFTPILHDLQFTDFQITPDGESIAVTDPGKRILKVFPLQQ